MNPIDHPHGGGEGEQQRVVIQYLHGVTNQGKKTRRNKRTTSMIVSRRGKEIRIT